ncbi:hypothetical protein HL658_32525 [Azospirillum sp. RWY-5-1]|uniref:peptidoglycan-binding domain-containing protein n=1 Tax=Azospirillum oleiclasticum TaxID=2735135 RepID=UPI0015D4E7ED|nr:hypothetical protein [Azospirillum oleiclasticum]NYZ17294.1 hypothetical protein [Azospirillum oleiclasticum]
MAVATRLQSKWFRDNSRLQHCLVSDPHHVLRGATGEHVSLIQGALSILDGSRIADDEQKRHLYGPTTENAVLEYKKRRRIINLLYQTQADAIVGKMTIRRLDEEMKAQERSRSHLMFAVGVSLPEPRMVILSETANRDFVGWANQMVKLYSGKVVKVDAATDPAEEVKRIRQAVNTAGAGGLLILSVGHGVCIPQFGEQGTFDLAPNAAMRVLGKNYNENEPKDFVSPYYDDKPAANTGLKPLSQKDKDERDQTPGAQRRLKNWALWQEVCKIFVDGKLSAVVLLTCRIGGAPLFLQKIAGQWRTKMIAYKDQVGCYQTASGRFRTILGKDKDKTAPPPPPHTNTPWGEITIPLSMTDMVVIDPPAAPKTP